MANYVLLRTVELSENTNPITIANIPQTGYTDLKVVLSARTSHNNGPDDWYMTVNGDTSSVYAYKLLAGSGSTVVNQQGSSQGGIYAGFVNWSSNQSNTFANIEIYFANYNSSEHKAWTIDGVYENNTTAAYQYFNACRYAKTNAISSITLGAYNNPWVPGTTVSVYGIAATGTTSTIAPKATGGNRISTDGTYWYHTFLSSGYFTPIAPITCDYLVVGGGGAGAPGGSSSSGAGAGGGGSSSSTLTGITNTNYAITIGAGGNGPGIGGNSSTISGSGITTITAGGGNPERENRVGGLGGTGTSGTGGTGGNGVIGSSSGNGGNGSAGNTFSISGTSTTYGGGGGGAGRGGGSHGTGGAGGGGNAGSTGSPGTANTGGGGGGTSTDNVNGGNGGSGVVIIRYAV
jgi:hypothetical protein